MIQAADIFKKIGHILNDLQDQHDYLTHHPEKINQPELQLFQANADFLAEHAKVYIKLKEAEDKEAAALYQPEQPASSQVEITGDPADSIDAPVSTPAVAEVNPTIEEVEEQESRVDLQPEEEIFTKEDDFKDDAPSPFEFILTEESLSDKFDFEEKPVAEIFDRKLTAEEEAVLASKKGVLNEVEPIAEEEEEDGPEPFLMDEGAVATAIEEVRAEAGTPLDEAIAAPGNSAEPASNTDKKPTINELLARNVAGNVNSAAKAGAVTDLKQAINLNDKLLYIKDLFNGYNLAYAEAIDILNKQPDFKAADNFLQKNYAVKNNWAEKQATVDRFYELLNRRFPAA